MSEETDEIREAQRAAYEGIREGWPSLWNPNETREWRVECPKCKGGRVDEVIIREFDNPLKINTRKTGIQGIDDCVNSETSLGPRYDITRDVYVELEWLEEEHGITSIQEAMKFLDENGYVPSLDDERILLPNGLYVKTKPDSDQKRWGESDSRWKERMLYEFTYQEVTAEGGEYGTYRKHFKCKDCGAQNQVSSEGSEEQAS